MDEQRQGCGAHLYIPALVPGEMLDADEEAETITYRLSNGAEWVDGSGRPTGGSRRYWHHAESGCVFTTEGDETPNDPTVEEIDADEFARLSALYSTDNAQT